MNTPERDQLTTFLQQLGQARATVKDAEAQTLIETAVAHQPDAAYLLVQRCLLQDNALQAAQAQIASLQAELQQAKSAAATAPASANFLDANGWGRAPVAPVAAYAPAPAYPQAAPAAALAPAAASRFQAPSFLTGMATTAAGVAAGAFLFQGIESLMGHHGSSALAGTPASAFGLSEPTAAAPEAAQSVADANTDVFGNDDGLDIGGDSSSDWA
ncbi:DUF2076 family protein [Rhodoferax sp.]|uniref:DUF2076 family protein n=1 Tax=Rhodoferax sp. TaxID=50421 RepID=UPI0025FACFF6|nr:DUF2076 family protein [Rhodoferax sp.]